MMHKKGWSRRGVIGAIGVAPLVGWGFARGENIKASLRLKVVETAGLRRFGYPVAVVLPGVGGEEGVKFRLSRDGKAIPAQFRRVMTPEGRYAVALDFHSNVGPGGTEEYTVTYGNDVEPGPEPRGGLHVERGDAGAFRVVHGPKLRFEVPGDLAGLLSAVGAAGDEYLRSGSAGLMLRGASNEGGDVRVGGAGWRGSVTREGPFAAALRFEGPTRLGQGRGGEVRSVVELTFPSSKSWVEAVWNVDDPEGLVGAMGAGWNLAVDGPPTLVDLGASNTVYGHLQGEESLVLEAGQAEKMPALEALWVVRRRAAAAGSSVFAMAPGEANRAAEGWAHVMDRTRCVALAVAGFGRSTRDSIAVRADGEVAAWREGFARSGGSGRGRKQLHMWLHFVPMPVQVGAATSPQAMLAPLRWEWGEGTG